MCRRRNMSRRANVSSLGATAPESSFEMSSNAPKIPSTDNSAFSAFSSADRARSALISLSSAMRMLREREVAPCWRLSPCDVM